MEEQPIEFKTTELNKTKPKFLIWTLLLIGAIGLVFFTTYNYLIKTDIDPSQTFTIEKGLSVREIANQAKNENLVRSELFLYLLLTTSYEPINIHAGQYVFSGQENIYGVAKKLASKEVEQDLVSVTLPEGIRVTEMAVLAALALPNFSVDEYLIKTDGKEGYLFPDTYFVPDDFTATDLVELQLQTYDEKTAELISNKEQTSLTEEEIVILASIIEREANDQASMNMVSGILQNRLEIGMPLQADATIEYVLDTPISELPPGQLANEIREKDTPYNSYKYQGLPPTPIGNPGLMAIQAVLNPTPSDFFYYITGNDGEFYYAKTLMEHNQNVAKYLR